MNITREWIDPLSSLRTAVRPHIDGQRVQFAASSWSILKPLLMANYRYLRNQSSTVEDYAKLRRQPKAAR